MMQEVTGELTEVIIKKSDSYPDLWCMVHDGEKIIAIVPPGGKIWASEYRTMVVGTSQELRDEINRLELEYSE